MSIEINFLFDVSVFQLMGLSRQRQRRLTEALTDVRRNNTLLDELIAWLNGAEVKLTDLDRESIPRDMQIIQDLIKQHQVYLMLFSCPGKGFLN